MTSRVRGTVVYTADVELELLARNEIGGDDSTFNASPAVLGDALSLRSNRSPYCIRASD